MSQPSGTATEGDRTAPGEYSPSSRRYPIRAALDSPAITDLHASIPQASPGQPARIPFRPRARTTDLPWADLSRNGNAVIPSGAGGFRENYPHLSQRGVSTFARDGR